MIILIPSFQPDQRLVDLVMDLAGVPGARVVVVDDGSGPDFRSWFDGASVAGAEVLTHPDNRGKGAALRTGFAHVRRMWPAEPVVCADSDGQHALFDILRVAAALTDSADMVLGVRTFTGRVPLRSRVGNAVTAAFFGLVTGVRIADTQTGLRGYPHRMLDWLVDVPGDRFEYELELLLRATREGLRISQVEIATVYLAGNASSHFRPVQDSVRVLGPLLGYLAASLGSFVVDAALLFALYPLLGTLAAAVVLARIGSAGVNFLANRHLVFRAGAEPLWPAVRRYALLAGGVLVVNLASMELLTPVMGLVAAKLVTETALFVAGYVVQRAVVFAPAGCAVRDRRRSSTRPMPDPAIEPSGSPDPAIEPSRSPDPAIEPSGPRRS